MNVRQVFDTDGAPFPYAVPEPGDKQDDGFERVLRELDTFLEATKKTDKEKAEEAKAAAEAKDRQKKISELYALIAQLRQKLMNSGGDKAVAAQLSVAQNELFWLLFSL